MRTRPVPVALALFLTAALPVAADSRMERSLRLDPGGRFSLDTDLGSVTVTGTSASGARLVITSRRRDLDDLLRFTFDEGPGSASVTARRRHKHLFGWDRGGSVHFEVQVPAATALDIDTSGGAVRTSGLRAGAQLETSGGRIEVRDHVGDVVGQTSGGGIALDRIKGTVRVRTSGGGIDGREIDGPISAETSGGSVTLERVSGDIRAESSGGGIEIAEAGGRVEADTSGGGIDATFARGNARGGSLETSGGGIRVAVDPSVGLEIDASGNSVQADLPITVHGTVSRSRLRGTLRGGGEILRLHTSGGGVRIRSL